MPRSALRLLLLATLPSIALPPSSAPARADEEPVANARVAADVTADDVAANDDQSKSNARADESSGGSTPAAGHSLHGDAFNEGPRQAAYLMEGMGTISFDVSTSEPNARKFFNQGVAQLHGFWYYEAERSFRQAAALDPDCAMCYWGMALANVNNRKRAEAFIKQGIDRKANASEREQLYLESVRKRFRESVDGKKLSKKETAEIYTRDLEEIVLKYPQDIEARAMLALQLWENERNDLPLVSHVAVEAVLKDVFDKQPMHPAHHYRIHLWDKRQPAQALESASLCGPSLPGIAHMWHMPGHTYSNLHRYQDAVWQQEASARVDHAHMMRDRILPDQIHNFAHNNEWMIRNMLKVGRVKDAVDLATNMIQLPRHPKFNSLKSGSAKYGRERLLQALSSYRLWTELIAAIDADLIERGDNDESQIEIERHLGIAYAMLDQISQAHQSAATLKARLEKVERDLREASGSGALPAMIAAKPDAGEPPAPNAPTSTPPAPNNPAADAPAADVASPAGACDDRVDASQKDDESQKDDASQKDDESQKDDVSEKDDASKKDANENKSPEDKKKAEANKKRRDGELASRKKELESRQKQLNEAIAAIEAAQAASSGQWDRALELFEKSGNWDKLLKVEWLARAQKLDSALELAETQTKENPGTVLPGALACYVRWQARGAHDAQAEFDRLRESACDSDLDTPLLARLEPLAIELGFESSWAKPVKPKPDIGQRPALDSLGPIRYTAYTAPTWQAKTREAAPLDSGKYAGKPVVVIFYLGFGCLHCVEQLQKFSPDVDKFKEAGIEIIGISTETPELLGKGMDAYAKPLSIPLVSDEELIAFKAFRCYDDFEKQPLHGTFFIDGGGKVLWQDISFEPFQDPAFLLKESQRLLKLNR